MGSGSSKHHTFEDYHEQFVFGQLVTHNIVRRSLENLLKETDPEQNGPKNADDADLLRHLKKYADLFRAFVVLHHKQEDRHIFPKAQALAEDESFLSEAIDDHKQLEELLVALGKLAVYEPPAPKKTEEEAKPEEQEKAETAGGEKEGDKDKAEQESAEKPAESGDAGKTEEAQEESPKDDAEAAEESPKEKEEEPKAEEEEKKKEEEEPAKSPAEIVTGLFEAAKGINEFMEAHLAREEKLLTAEFWREKTTEKDVKNLNDDIHKIVKSGEFLNRGLGLVWMQYHLTPNEQMFFHERVPKYPVQRWLFPGYAKKVDVGVWKLAFNPKFNEKGDPVWPDPVWEGGDEPAAEEEKKKKEKGAKEDDAEAGDDKDKPEEEENSLDKEEAAEDKEKPVMKPSADESLPPDDDEVEAKKQAAGES